MPTKIEKDAVSGVETTGHEWDGIKELNNPLPRWWIYTFYATIAFSLLWVVLYPAIPTLSGHSPGTLGYTQRTAVEARLAAARAAQAPMLNRIAAASLEQIRSDPALAAFAQAGGRIAFAENCAGCHQAGGAGARGFPNLADDDWLWGGSLDAIQQTIAHGIRNADERSRNSAMPRFGVDGILTAAQIADVADHVLSLSGAAAGAGAARGASLYAENCAACHGEAGEGNREQGAPRLGDRIWLNGGDKPAIVRMIANPAMGVMPAWSARLDAATVKMLAVYVHALGGGE